MSKNTVVQRKDVLLEDTWRLEDIFETDAKVNETMTLIKTKIGEMSQFKGKLLSSGSLLFDALTAEDQLSILLGKVYVYSHMRLHQDGGNSFYQDLASRTETLMIEAGSQTSYMLPELKALTTEMLESFMHAFPKLEIYRRQLLEILRQKEHILDDASESLLSQFQEIAGAPSNIYSMFNNADITFPSIKDEAGDEVRLTQGRYIQFLESQDRRVRQDAFEALYSTYAQYRNTIASIFSSNIKQFDLFAKIRGFESPLVAALDSNNIPTTVYTNLIETVHTHMDLIHDYFAIRKEHLGLDELHMYDLNVPLSSQFEKKISFDEAKQIVLDAMAPLGADYQALLKEAFENRWIDKYENQGKRTGAYSWGTFAAPHPYVLMNYTDNVNNLFTLAHEMGHALHSYLSNQTQPYPYAQYCIFVAEVASTVNEALLMQHLLKTVTDPEFKQYLTTYFIGQFRSTLYRQTMFAEFEKKIHDMNVQGVTLTADLLSDTYYELVKLYHGDAVCVDQTIAMEWARIPHFYTPFYVYQYATGYSAAIALSQKILTGGESAVSAYKDFLRCGSSADPIDLLKGAGVDMSTPQPIVDALAVFKGLLDQLKNT
ncbi:MAG: oligoendopeptidase F [Cellulosilyticaceae bacterium]